MATGCVSIADLDSTVAESSSETEVKIIKCNHKWTIKNFSICSIDPRQPLHSRVFGSEIDEGIEWRLKLYAGGKDDESQGYIACYLELVTSSYDMAVKFDLYILNQNGEKIYYHGNVEPQMLWPKKTIGFDNYVSRQYIFDKGNGLLHDDNLTICCEIAASPFMLTTIKRCGDKDFIKLSYTWVIEESRSLFEAKGKTVVSPIFFYPARCKLKWQLRLGLDRRFGYISFYLCSVSTNSAAVRPRVILSLISSKSKKENVSKTEIWTFDKIPSRRGYDLFADSNFVFKEKNGFLPHGELTVRCVMGYPAKWHDDVADSDSTMPTIPACRLSDDLEILFATKKLSDVTLVVGEREIQAHKTVLAARSSVFSAMFEHKMEEQTSNRVKINDIDYEVLNDMLRFMYTGKANHVRAMAAELLKAADKYDLQRLKVMCGRELFSNLNIENATQLYMLAHAHNAEYLKTAAIRFIAKQRDAITQTEDFKLMTESHPQFICDLLDRLSLLE